MSPDSFKGGAWMPLVRSSIPCAALVFFLACLAGLSQVRARDSDGADDSTARFLVEYRKHAARLNEATANIRCEFRCSKTDTDGKVEELVGAMYAKGKSRQLVQDGASPSDAGRERSLVVSSAPAIGFHLRRADPNGPYEVASLDRSTDAARREQVNAGIAVNVDPFVNAALQIFDLSIPACLDDPQTRFKVHIVSREARDCYELDLAFPESPNKRAARAVLDPSLEFAVREYEISFDIRPGSKVRFVRKGLVKCERLQDGAVVPKSVRTETILSGSKNANPRFTEVEFMRVVRGDVDDSQFTLTAFGIPDAPPSRSRRLYPFDRSYFWLLVALACGAWLYARRARQRSKPVGGSPS